MDSSIVCANLKKKYIYLATHMVDVAQLVRASVCGTEGRGFESRLPPLSLKALILLKV